VTVEVLDSTAEIDDVIARARRTQSAPQAEAEKMRQERPPLPDERRNEEGKETGAKRDRRRRDQERDLDRRERSRRRR
jgi:hypothetical protein